MRKQTKIAALVSAAALLAIGASMTALAQPGWNIDAASGTATYHDRYDDPMTDVWETWTDGKYYYFGDDGYMVRSELVEYNNNTYYVDSTGAKVTEQWVRFDNNEGDTVGGYDVSYIYYYFNDKGIAQKGGPKTLKKYNGATDTAKFFFDDYGRMLSGWQTIDSARYYLGEETDGMMRTGWVEMEQDPETIEDYTVNPYEDGTVWYYFDSGKRVENKRKYLAVSTGAKYWFAFDANGVLVEDSWSDVGLASYAESFDKANPPALKAYYKPDGYQTSGWVQKDHIWYYLDAKGVPFNYAGTQATGANATVAGTAAKWNEATGKFELVQKSDTDTTANKVAAKVIKNKTYLFNEGGQMLTGLYRLDGVNCVGSANKLGKEEIYYFDSDGAKVTNKKIPVTTDDMTYNYSFDSNGVAAENKIVKGILYGENGKRVDALDTTWMVVEVDTEIETDKNTTIDATTASKYNKTMYPNTTKIIVNANGRVKEYGTVTIDGTKYWIKNITANDRAAVENDKDAAKIDGEAYVVVYEAKVD